MAKELMSLGIPCTVILDSAIGYVMEQVDMVMVGAEGVMESGGIVNKVSVCSNQKLSPTGFLRNLTAFRTLCCFSLKQVLQK